MRKFLHSLLSGKFNADSFLSGRAGIWYRKYANDLWKEFFRKSIHLCTAFVPFFLSKFYYLTVVLLFIVLVVYIISELLRMRGKQIPLLSSVTVAAARKRDENRFVLGPVTLCSGVLLTSLVFPPVPAKIGIYALALGDGLASLCGKIWGKRKIPFTGGKSYAGSMACFFAVFVSTFLCTFSFKIGFVVALCGMLIELLPLKDFDNILIPLLLAALCRFVFCL